MSARPDLDALDPATVRRGLIVLAAELRRVQATRRSGCATATPVRR